MSRHVPTIHGIVELSEEDDAYLDYLDELVEELPGGQSYGLLLLKAEPLAFYAGRDEWLRENSNEEGEG